MLVSTCTGVFVDRLGFKQALKTVKQTGFTAYDATFDRGNPFSPRPPFDGEDYIEVAKELRSYADELGLPCNQAHAVFGSSAGSGVKGTKLYDTTVRCMEIAAILGAKSIVVHPMQYVDYMNNVEFLKQENFRFYSDLIPVAEKLGIVILTENMWQNNPNNNCIIQSTCAEAKEFCEYVDMLNSPYLKACLDVGHAHLIGECVPNMIKSLGKDRLYALHIHDVDGVNDNHTLPFTQKVNFEEMTDALAEIGYDRDITFEVRGFYRNFPDELLPSAARIVADIGHYFVKSIESKKNIAK